MGILSAEARKLVDSELMTHVFDERAPPRDSSWPSMLFHPRSGTLFSLTRERAYLVDSRDSLPCLHLSLSFRRKFPEWPKELYDARALSRLGAVVALRQFDLPMAKEWILEFFPVNHWMLWFAAATTPRGALLSVIHLFAFTDDDWMPRVLFESERARLVLGKTIVPWADAELALERSDARRRISHG